jgi:hypothetical protein
MCAGFFTFVEISEFRLSSNFLSVSFLDVCRGSSRLQPLKNVLQTFFQVGLVLCEGTDFAFLETKPNIINYIIYLMTGFFKFV